MAAMPVVAVPVVPRKRFVKPKVVRRGNLSEIAPLPEPRVHGEGHRASITLVHTGKP